LIWTQRCPAISGGHRIGHAFLGIHKQDDQPDRPTLKDIGNANEVTRSSVGAQSGSVRELEVTHLSTGAIEPALVTVPPTSRSSN
jgi:hypothetical protein